MEEWSIDPRILGLGTRVGMNWSASRPTRFTPAEIVLGAHWIGGWRGPQSLFGWCGEETNFAPTGIRTPTPRPSSP
jgi:hypothetical protein